MILEALDKRREQARRERVSKRSFSPQPYQELPEGDWDLYILQGGRDAGKSQTLAWLLDEHVHGPPCDPRIPGGHRPVIAGPTLGDAIASLFKAPGGVQGINPDVGVVQKVGGTYMRWPGGTEGVVLGAYSTEDVERFRAAATNSCLAEGSRVLTDRGWRPIETVGRGDRVWTRAGWRAVLAQWDNGLRQVATFSDGRLRLDLTPDHKVFSERGWIAAGLVADGDTVATWSGPIPLTSPTRHSGMGDAGDEWLLPRVQNPITQLVGTRFFTALFTRWLTGRFRMGGTSTMRTKIPSITIPQISRRTQHRSIRGFIQGRGNGMPREDGPHGQIEGQADAGVRSVGRRSFRAAIGAAMLSTAQISVDFNISRVSILERLNAWSAAQDSEQASTNRAELVPVFARIDWGTGRVARVYDLTIEGQHEYVAEGFLVHNCFAAVDELASWRQLGPAMQNLELAVRVGPRPRIVGATTPKARKDYRELIKRKSTLVRRVSITENKHANPERVAAWIERYEGTRLGRQELYGELLQDVDGALWAWDTIEKARGTELPKIDGVIVESALAHLDKVVVAVDPAFSGKGDETGIVVAGAHGDRRAEVLADLSVRATPDGWGRAVVAAYRTFRADTVVVETNLGGPELVRGIVRQIDPAVHITDVRASRGKLLRAEPIAALYEQGRITHRGSFDELETQMTDWTSDSSESPDRLDALVYALTHLVVDASGPVTTSAKQTAGIRLAR